MTQYVKINSNKQNSSILALWNIKICPEICGIDRFILKGKSQLKTITFSSWTCIFHMYDHGGATYSQICTNLIKFPSFVSFILISSIQQYSSIKVLDYVYYFDRYM